MFLENESVIIQPILTEKSNLERVENKKYYFEVHPLANKIQIAKILNKLFKVQVAKCNIVNMPFKKFKSRQRKISYRNRRKKAIVTLKKDSPEFLFYENY